MKKTRTRFYIVLAAFFMLALLAVGMISPASTHMASAATATYSNVLDDLTKDKSFNIGDYPVNSNDHSIQVIQIAESTKGELFVYVYNPCASTKLLTATSISLSTESEKINPKLYSLTLLNCWGVFGKYRVDGFKVLTDLERYYEIPEIFRAWDSDIDALSTGASSVGGAISEKAFSVGKLYTATTKNGVVSYECFDREVVEILNPFYGSLRYVNGFSLYLESCDSWFIAFSTDKQIDRLMSATVHYVSQAYTKTTSLAFITDTSYADPIEHYEEVTDKDSGSNSPNGWLKGKSRTWKRIQTADNFIETESLTSSAQEKVIACEWVLRFAETKYKTLSGTAGSKGEQGTKISDVTILRLEFETDGKVYNLGAVNDRVTPDDNPDNPWEDQYQFEFEKPRTLEWWEKIWNFLKDLFTGHSDWWVYVIVAVVVIVAFPTILAIFIPAVKDFLLWLLKAIGRGLLWLLKGLWWLICLPFRVIVVLVRKIKKE